MSREHFSIRNFNDSSFNYKYFVRINNKISKFINFHPNIYTYESLKIIAIANYTHMLDIFASYKLNRWKSVDSPEQQVGKRKIVLFEQESHIFFRVSPSYEDNIFLNGFSNQSLEKISRIIFLELICYFDFLRFQVALLKFLHAGNYLSVFMN